jgi:hypothetical protein
MLEMPKLPERERLGRIAFYGPMCSGKTWCADYLVKYNYYKKLAFASKLKAIAYELFGIDSKNDEGRRVLQELGTKLREIDRDVWIKYLLADVAMHELAGKTPRRIVLDDLRYTNEAKALKQNGFTLIRVDCPDEVRAERIARLYPNTSNTAKEHPSEREWQLIKPDHVVTSIDYGAAFSIQKILGEENPEVSRTWKRNNVKV